MEGNQCITVYIKPGEIYASSDPVCISTVLGSCVCVCLHDKVNKVGGANHYLLAYQKEKEENPLRYGDKSIQELINMVIREGGDKRSLVAQIIGGSCSHQGNIHNTGQQNIEIARKLLAENSIPVIREDTGGNYGRVIKFFTHSNELYIRKAGERKTNNEPYIRNAEERKTNMDIQELPSSEKSVELSKAQSVFLYDMFSSGIQTAKQTLSSMCGAEADISIIDITVRKMSYVQEYVTKKSSEFIISTGQKDKGALGEVLMLMDSGKLKAMIQNILKQLIATTPESGSLNYQNLENSAIVEVANIIINAIIGTLANHLNFFIALRIPELIRKKEDLASILFMDNCRQWKICLAVKTNLYIPSFNLNTTLLLLVEINSPFTFFKSLE